jgi:hypothetical protein
MKERSSGRNGLRQALAANNLTALLAERVMGWTVAPDRFLTGKRGWTPRWKFQPFKRLDHAFRLLDQLAPEKFTMGATEDGCFWAKVRVAGTTGEAHESSKAMAITFAVARALGIDVEANG